MAPVTSLVGLLSMQDFDRSNAYTRGLTKSQFGRVLQFLSLPLLKEDFRLLCRKFENPVGGDINYVAFVQVRGHRDDDGDDDDDDDDDGDDDDDDEGDDMG